MSGISNPKGPLYGTFSYTKVINQNPWSLTRVVFVTNFCYLGKNKQTNKQGAVNCTKDFLGKKQGPKSSHFKGEKKKWNSPYLVYPLPKVHFHIDKTNNIFCKK
jgi:hypothetical protein